MIFEELPLKGAYKIDLNLLEDSRGGFTRYYCKKEFEKIGLINDFVQMNHSYNYLKGTLRGMHYQKNPHEELKLVRCIKGSVLDVIIDLRRDSNTFLQHFSIELSEKNKTMIVIPENFAHGFQTLEDNSELIYHHTEFYNREAEDGLLYNDPQLKIKWPLPVTNISEKDKGYTQIKSKQFRH